MSRLYMSLAVVAVLALALMPALAQDIQPTQNSGDPSGDGFGASLGVSITVDDYAEVIWGQPDEGDVQGQLALSISGPVAWDKGVNWDNVPLTLRSNCTVQLTLIEGLGDALLNAEYAGAPVGLPAAMIWGQQDDGGDFGGAVYRPTVDARQPGNESPTEPYGQIFLATGDDLGGVLVNRDQVALPEGGGVGGSGWNTWTWGDYVGEPGKGVPPTSGTMKYYDGTMVIPVAVGIQVSTSVYTDTENNDWDWSDLPAGATIPPAKVWAIVSAPAL